MSRLIIVTFMLHNKYMNANTLINDTMSLDEKLKAIDEALKNAQAVENEQRVSAGLAPLDPALLTICDGCE